MEWIEKAINKKYIGKIIGGVRSQVATFCPINWIKQLTFGNKHFLCFFPTSDDGVQVAWHGLLFVVVFSMSIFKQNGILLFLGSTTLDL